MEPLRRTYALMESQLGVARRKQLLAECGLTRGQLDNLVRRGRLESAGHGVLRAPGSPRSPRQGAMAAVLRCPPGSRLTGEFVAALYGMEGFALTSVPLRVLVPGRRTVDNVGFETAANPLPRRFEAVVDGLPAVTPARALIEAKTATGAQLRAAVDSGRWAGLLPVERLSACIAAFGDHDGALRLRAALDAGVFDLESEGERAAWPLISRLRPRPELQAWVTPRIRVDFLWRAAAYVLEYHGEGHDGQRMRDRQRTTALEDLGFAVEVITAADLRDVEATRRRIQRVLDRRVGRG